MRSTIYIEKTFREFQREQRETLFRDKRYLFHIAIWLLSAVMFYFSPENNDLKNINQVNSELFNKYLPLIKLVSTIIGLVISAFFVYTFLLLIVPYSKFKARNRYIILSILLQIFMFLGSLIVLGVIHGFYELRNEEPAFINFEIFIQSWLSIIYIQFNFIALYFFLDIFDKQKTIRNYSQLLKQRLIAESKFLSSQINPHFLFNTLNNIYSLSMKGKEKSITGIEKLESLIEYIHHKSQNDAIPLNEEIKFLQSYIDLELLRYHDASLDVQFNISGETDDVSIAPLLLINFIENAFKHGISNNKVNPYMHISLEVQNTSIIFRIENPVVNSGTENDLEKQSGGIGLKNTARRLELIYPNTHKLKIIHKKDTYLAELQIDRSDD